MGALIAGTQPIGRMLATRAAWSRLCRRVLLTRAKPIGRQSARNCLEVFRSDSPSARCADRRESQPRAVGKRSAALDPSDDRAGVAIVSSRDGNGAQQCGKARLLNCRVTAPIWCS